MRNRLEDALLGVAIGDALGVPVEFMRREDIAKDPVTGMRGFGTHNQPPGTWSDDTSLTLCLADSLAQGFNTEHIGSLFESWLYDRLWTARGKVFDIGNTTRRAIDNIVAKRVAEEAGPKSDDAQGNGSLMRILPIVFCTADRDMDDRWDMVRRVSSITHGHINCSIACFIYTEYARELLLDKEHKMTLGDHYRRTVAAVDLFFKDRSQDTTPFARVLGGELSKLDKEKIRSTGYVIDTLEASLWCFLNTSDFRSAVLKAVNLGDDTDTTGAVTGGLAGLWYGLDDIPKEWLEVLARRWDIVDVAERLQKRLG